MAVSLESSSPSHLHKDPTISMNSSSSSPLFSPTSEERFWSALRNRVDTLLENRKLEESLVGSDLHLLTQSGSEEAEKCKRLKKDDCLLLLRGFDSVSSSLSQLTSNLDTALNGTKELARQTANDQEKPSTKRERKRGVKRKTSHESCDDQGDSEQEENKERHKTGKLKNAKHLAVAVATKAATLARELKSIKSDLCFMNDRCSMLEEENRRLREGYEKGTRPEEDDLVRLQLEALLAEKSRLARENANLTRENECLHQLVEYHQLTSQDIAESYEQVINGTCLDFSSPQPSVPEEDYSESESGDDIEDLDTPRADNYGLSTSLDGWLSEEKQR